MTKEKEDAKVRKRAAIEERDAAIKRLSEIEKEVSALSDSLHIEKEQSSLFKELCEWAILGTTKKMTTTLIDTHDAETINIDEVISRFHIGIDEALSHEAFLRARGTTSSSEPPKDS